MDGEMAANLEKVYAESARRVAEARETYRKAARSGTPAARSKSYGGGGGGGAGGKDGAGGKGGGGGGRGAGKPLVDTAYIASLMA